MCIPKGYHIVDIYEEDLNGDGREDKVAEWFKEKLSNGDTTFHSIYFQEPDSTFRHFTTYNNLAQLYFDLQSQDSDVILEDSFLNEIKFRYHTMVDCPRSMTELFRWSFIQMQRVIKSCFSSFQTKEKILY